VSVLRSHIVLMLIYALATALFFTLLWKSGKRDRIRFFVFVFIALFFGGIALAWAMYPFPLR
jgi:cytochrome bd-type quinol oxidase subunit 2